mmetsp:Transcript_34441/g.52033  ORF Transcript_34441/g.52033 Transcript_34441/m.52033 type:complete len:204 (+) Transcript_34441:520-1131(+)
MQDQLTMQGQDFCKVMHQKWSDVTPTPSDAGVKAMQRWMRQYGSFGPFPLNELSAHQGREMSSWDSHGRYCPQCQETIRRLDRAEKILNKISSISLGSSLLGVAVSSLLYETQKRYPVCLQACSVVQLHSSFFQCRTRCFSVLLKVNGEGNCDERVNIGRIYLVHCVTLSWVKRLRRSLSRHHIHYCTISSIGALSKNIQNRS